MENNYNTITLFVKEREIKNGDKAGQKFPDYFAKINGTPKFISVNMTKVAKAYIDVNKLELPIGIVLDEEDFFIKEETYENELGIEMPKYVLVLCNISKTCEPELTKTTIADIIDKL